MYVSPRGQVKKYGEVQYQTSEFPELAQSYPKAIL